MANCILLLFVDGSFALLCLRRRRRRRRRRCWPLQKHTSSDKGSLLRNFLPFSLTNAEDGRMLMDSCGLRFKDWNESRSEQAKVFRFS